MSTRIVTPAGDAESPFLQPGAVRMNTGASRRWVVSAGMEVGFSMGWRLITSMGLVLCMVAGRLPAQEITVATLKPPAASLREVFVNVGSIRELADGRVLIADAQDRRFVVADFARNRVADIPSGTREGELPDGLGLRVWALGGDSSVITDARIGWFGILEGTRLVDAFKMSDGVTNRPPVDRVGSYLSIIRTGPWTEQTHHPDSVGRLLHCGRTIDTLTTMLVSRVIEVGDPPGTRIDPYEVAERATMASDGWVAVVRVAPYRIDWWSPTSGWHEGKPIDVPAVPLVGAELAAKKERPVTRDPRWVHEYPADVPRFSTRGRLPTNEYHRPDVLATPDSLVLVRITPTLAYPGTRYDVIDRQGVLRHTLVLPVNEWIVGFGGGTVYVVQQKSRGEHRLLRHPWP